MAFMNNNFNTLHDSYFFATIRTKIKEFTEAYPEKKIINMGIGDVTLPISPAVLTAIHKAVDEMEKKETFRGYGPERGYSFLHEAVKGYYKKLCVSLFTDEIFIGDGIKSDIGDFTDLLNDKNIVMIPNPVYPAYVDANIISGRRIIYLNANAGNDFLPMPPADSEISPDIIYLCSPNNPTGAVYKKEQLKVWVEYAKKVRAIIFFDAAYECFIRDTSLPRSIYEIEGAKECAVEFCSLSKMAGFTGIRCGYTVVPKELLVYNSRGDAFTVNKLWLRRQLTRFNGVPYIVQRGAEAAFTQEGQKQIRQNIDYYTENIQIIAETMKTKGIKYYGGENAPYIWLRCFHNMTSWEFFDYILNEIAVVGMPGAGFGVDGEGYYRLTAFGSHEDTTEAMARFKLLNINC